MPAYEFHYFANGEPLTLSDFNRYIAKPINLLAPTEANATTAGAVAANFEVYFLPPNSAVMATGYIIGARSDYGAGLFARVGATWRRVGTANAVIAGSYVEIYEDSAGAPQVFIGNFAPNVCYFYVQGVAAETWYWRAVYSFQEL